MIKRLSISLVALVVVLGMVACSNGNDKPSRAEYRAGIERALETAATAGLSVQNKKQLLDCLVQNTYEKLSDDAVKFVTTVKFDEDTVKKAKDEGLEDDFKKVQDELAKCYDRTHLYGLAPSKKSLPTPKTNLRSAITAVKSVQVGDGIEDFASITVDRLNQDEPDLKFASLPLDTTADSDTVGIQVATPTQVILQTREPLLGLCFFVELNADSTIRYGSSIVGPKNECGLAPDPKTGSDYTIDQQSGWSTKADK